MKGCRWLRRAGQAARVAGVLGAVVAVPLQVAHANYTLEGEVTVVDVGTGLYVVCGPTGRCQAVRDANGGRLDTTGRYGGPRFIPDPETVLAVGGDPRALAAIPRVGEGLGRAKRPSGSAYWGEVPVEAGGAFLRFGTLFAFPDGSWRVVYQGASVGARKECQASWYQLDTGYGGGLVEVSEACAGGPAPPRAARAQSGTPAKPIAHRSPVSANWMVAAALLAIVLVALLAGWRALRRKGS